MRWHDVRLFSVPAWYGSGVTFEGVAKYIGSELAVDLRRGTQSSQKTKREALRYIITRQEQTRLATDGHRLSCHFKGLPKWTQGHLVNCQYGTMGHIETSGLAAPHNTPPTSRVESQRAALTRLIICDWYNLPYINFKLQGV